VPDLEVTFIDELYELEPGGELGFGRDAELVVDDSNPYMHRRIGTFIHHDGDWWLRNDGRSAELVILSALGTRIVLAPRAAQVLTGGSGLVRFSAGSLHYELAYQLAGLVGPPPPATAEHGAGSGPTADFGALRLNEEQRLLLAALAERLLADPAAEAHELPTNHEVAHRLGWSLRKFDRKLDYLCRRLDEQGVRGLRGRQGEQASDRRRVLVIHVVRTGLITADDLALLGGIDGGQ
jgi:hypothetical protein